MDRNTIPDWTFCDSFQNPRNCPGGRANERGKVGLRHPMELAARGDGAGNHSWHLRVPHGYARWRQLLGPCGRGPRSTRVWSALLGRGGVRGRVGGAIGALDGARIVPEEWDF